MGNTEFITVGKTTFRVDVLKNLTQKDALNMFPHLNKDSVKHAHAMCNPKKKTTKKSGK